MEKVWDTYYPIETYTETLPDNNPYEGGYIGKDTPTGDNTTTNLSSRPVRQWVADPLGGDSPQSRTTTSLKGPRMDLLWIVLVDFWELGVGQDGGTGLHNGYQYGQIRQLRV